MSVDALGEIMVNLPPSPLVRRFGRVLSEAAVTGLIIDLGCYTGRNSRYLAALGHTVVGIDQNCTAIRAAEALTAESSVQQCRFQTGDIRSLALTKQCAAVLINEVLHQLSGEEAPALLQAARDATLPGGYHAVSDYLWVSGSVPGQPNYLLPGQLQANYDQAGWETLFYREAMTSPVLIDGRVVNNWQAAIIARRPLGD